MTIINKNLTRSNTIKTILYSIVFSLGIILFLAPADLISTGLTGVAQMIVYTLNKFNIFISFSVVYLLINIPGLLLGSFKVGKKFTYYSFISILTVTFVTSFINELKLTSDILLNCIFAGVLMGYGLGGLLKIGASSGGTDFYAQYLYKKYNIKFATINIFLNVVIIIFSLFLYNVEIALYTFLCLCIRQITTNFIYTNNNKILVWIVGKDLGMVSQHINEKIKRGTSIFKHVEGGYSQEEKEVIMVVLNIYEYAELKEDIYRINPNVFMVTSKVNNILGNYKSKRDFK